MTILDDLFSLTNRQLDPQPIARFVRRARRVIDKLVAAAIARRQRQVDLMLLRDLSNRELKDIGLYRSQIEYGLQDAARGAMGEAGHRKRQLRESERAIWRQLSSSSARGSTFRLGSRLDRL